MIRLTDGEWKVMAALWREDGQHLGQIVEALAPETGWSRTTVHTYLTRMMDKGLIRAEGRAPRRYYALAGQKECAEGPRRDLVERFYGGSAGQLVASFLRDGSLSRKEREELRRLLDEMEV